MLMTEIVLASSNEGKLRELNYLLENKGLKVVPQSRFGIPDAVESGLTFVENALIKARHATSLTGLPAIADDSGLAVDALGGAPGIYSARFAGPQACDADNNRLLVEKLRDVPESERIAQYHCVLVYLLHESDPTPLICDGTWEGRIILEPRGSNGFGYDSYFYLKESDCTAAELTSEGKNAISHRAKAMQKLITLI